MARTQNTCTCVPQAFVQGKADPAWGIALQLGQPAYVCSQQGIAEQLWIGTMYATCHFMCGHGLCIGIRLELFPDFVLTSGWICFLTARAHGKLRQVGRLTGSTITCAQPPHSRMRRLDRQGAVDGADQSMVRRGGGNVSIADLFSTTGLFMSGNLM